jgi:hypothetical protein
MELITKIATTIGLWQIMVVAAAVCMMITWYALLLMYTIFNLIFGGKNND